MAGGQERILRGRIRSVQATKKITRAMELIAGSRIVKAQQRVSAAVPYSEKITEVVKHLSAGGAVGNSPFLAGRPEVKTTCYVAITADRGLCGGYNTGVLRATEGEIKADLAAGKTTSWFLLVVRPRVTCASAVTTWVRALLVSAMPQATAMPLKLVSTWSIFSSPVKSTK